MRRRAVLPTLLTAALAVSGCASESSGYSRVDARQVVLVPATASTAGAGAGASMSVAVALACGARAEAVRLHEQLRVARPSRASGSAQILVLDAVTALKPGGVIIAPIAPGALLAPIVSMWKAGIHVIALPAAGPASAGAAAREGALAVARVLAAIRGGSPAQLRGNNLRASCAPAHLR